MINLLLNGDTTDEYALHEKWLQVFFTIVTLLGSLVSSSGFATQQTLISHAGPSPIPDNQPLGLNIDFAAPALNQISDIRLDIDMQHTWVGDLTARLIAPDGDRHVVFQKTGSTNGVDFSDSSNLSGLYTFSDLRTPTNNWWQAAAVIDGNSVIPPGVYRSTLVQTGADTFITPSFAPTYPAGNWRLNIVDSVSVDVGTVNSATLHFIHGARNELTTSLLPNNSNRAVFFDITARDKDIVLERIDTFSATPNAHVLTLYYKPGTYVDSITTPDAWTNSGSGTVQVTNGQNLAFNNSDVVIPAGETYGFYLYSSLSGLRYQNGPSVPAEFENRDIIVESNHASGNIIPFGVASLFTPRFFT